MKGGGEEGEQRVRRSAKSVVECLAATILRRGGGTRLRFKGGEPKVDVKCPECGTENWLENQSRCHCCNAILRRCVACKHYDLGRELCQTLGTTVDRQEAETPSLLSVSTNCSGYEPAHRVVPRSR
jgi:hypothetical protein